MDPNDHVKQLLSQHILLHSLSGSSGKLMYNRWHHIWEVPYANDGPTA
jgi:hypothetical protein